jgi:hypothetical protein
LYICYIYKIIGVGKRSLEIMKQSPAAAEWAGGAQAIEFSNVEHIRPIPESDLPEWREAADVLVGVTVTPVTEAVVRTIYRPSEGKPRVVHEYEFDNMPVGHVGVKVTATPDAHNAGKPGHLTEFWKHVGYPGTRTPADYKK